MSNAVFCGYPPVSQKKIQIKITTIMAKMGIRRNSTTLMFVSIGASGVDSQIAWSMSHVSSKLVQFVQYNTEP